MIWVSYYPGQGTLDFHQLAIAVVFKREIRILMCSLLWTQKASAMNTNKFACPHCQQHIECDDSYAGMKINCPTCEGEIIVPGGASTPAPTPAPGPASHATQTPPAPATRLSLSQTAQHASSVPPSPKGSSAASRPLRPKASGRGGGSKAKSILSTSAVVVALIIGLILVLYVIKDKWGQQQEKSESDSGQTRGLVGHIGELNTTMDVMADLGSGGGKQSQRSRSGPEDEPTLRSLENLPLLSPTWTMDLQAARIPETKANGSLSGSKFVVEKAYLLTGGPTPILSLRQGGAEGSYAEILVYFGHQSGGSLEGSSWNVTAQDATSNAQVVLRWNSGGIPGQKTFSRQYALRLELGQAVGGIVPGKIFLSLPDADQSVVAGLFQATIHIAGASQTTSASPGHSGPGGASRGGPGMDRGRGAGREPGAGAGQRRGPANVILKERAREFGADGNGQNRNP